MTTKTTTVMSKYDHNGDDTNGSDKGADHYDKHQHDDDNDKRCNSDGDDDATAMIMTTTMKIRTQQLLLFYFLDQF